MATPYRALFFDMGGTLFSYREVVRATMPVLAEGARRLRTSAEGPELGRAFGTASMRANAIYGELAYFLHRDFFYEIFRGFAEELGSRASQDFLDWIYMEQRRAFIEEIELRVDCLQTLAALRERGLYLSVVSNIDDDYLQPMVERLGLSALLDDWTSSEEARSCKPDPAFFSLALSKAGCRAEEVLFVGDSRIHDVAGARNAGMETVLIEEKWELSLADSADASLPEPHHHIEELAELLPLVE